MMHVIPGRKRTTVIIDLETQPYPYVGQPVLHIGHKHHKKRRHPVKRAVDMLFGRSVAQHATLAPMDTYAENKRRWDHENGNGVNI